MIVKIDRKHLPLIGRYSCSAGVFCSMQRPPGTTDTTLFRLATGHQVVNERCEYEVRVRVCQMRTFSHLRVCVSVRREGRYGRSDRYLPT